MSNVIEPTFGYLVGDVARLLRKDFNQRARDVELSLTQCRALCYLARHEGINQARLADLLEIQPITLARLLDRMASAGWIERRPDPVDRRAHRLYLAERAWPLIDRAQALAAETRHEALSGLADDEKETLMRLLLKVHGNLCNREPTGPLESVDP